MKKNLLARKVLIKIRAIFKNTINREHYVSEASSKLHTNYTDYQGVQTIHSTRFLHAGRFADAFEKYASLDRFHAPNVVRYRTYNICQLADKCKNLDGDFVFVGVSWGVAARTTYDFANLQKSGKVVNLVDPFIGINNTSQCTAMDKYNTDIDFVKRQYSPIDRVVFHQSIIPNGLPLENVKKLAFVHLNTGDYESESRSLEYFYTMLAPGGWILIDNYAIGEGHFEIYDPILSKLKVEPIWFPSGQVAINKVL